MALSFSLSAGVTSIHSFIHSCRLENRGGGRVLGVGLTPPTQENRVSASLNCKAWLWRWGSCDTSGDAHTRTHTHTLGAKGSWGGGLQGNTGRGGRKGRVRHRWTGRTEGQQGIKRRVDWARGERWREDKCLMQCFTSPKAVGQWEPNTRPGKSPSRRWRVSRVSVRGRTGSARGFSTPFFLVCSNCWNCRKKRRDRHSCSFNSCSFEDSVKGKERWTEQNWREVVVSVWEGRQKKIYSSHLVHNQNTRLQKKWLRKKLNSVAVFVTGYSIKFVFF